MAVIQSPDAAPQEPAEEVELGTSELPDECGEGSTVMPWLLPALAIAAFFAFVALLVLLIV
jgi:hypothetical protein